MEAKLYFDSEEEMLKCLDEWQERLGLSDWYIGARICKMEDMKLKDCAGESEVQFVNKCGLISILDKDELPSDMILKQPHEQTLIHELLHFKFIGFEEKSREEAVFEILQHQLIEELARALYRSKYNLDRNWLIVNKQ